ncbi:MAG TPA: SUMF1/EgtB/PvdO family nonheme iron enzyme, partial [Armatimonadota bacterium]
SGPLGQVVTITGTSLTGATEVTFNGTPALGFTVDSDTAITTTVPSGATTGKIAVTTDGGTATSVATFTVYQPPTIVSFTPTLGPVGRVVLLTGTNFTGATAVTFNGTPAKTFGVGSATSMSAIVPSGATTGPIAVTTPGGIAVSTEDFTVYAPPTIISFTPNKGPVGQTVTITGTNFTGTTSVKFNGAASIWFTVVSAKSITARVPSGASTGRITVTTPGGTATSVAEFSVTGVTSTNATDGAAMVWVPAGTFPMGSIGGVGDANERPVHSVSHDGYWIYKYEVTVAQYRAFCTATSRALPPFPSGKSWTGKTGWGDPALQQHPIVNVTWDDASAYAEWARVQLPTEAQWEYAARGARGNNYPWGGTATELDQYNGCDWTKCANAYNSFPLGKSTWPVGSFPLGASWCGAQDMAGNVWEWCADWYDEYTSVPLYNPSGPLDGVSHVLRGGSWKDNAEYYCRTAHRESLYYLDSSKDNYGFRCVYAPNYYFDY